MLVLLSLTGTADASFQNQFQNTKRWFQHMQSIGKSTKTVGGCWILDTPLAMFVVFIQTLLHILCADAVSPTSFLDLFRPIAGETNPIT